MGRTISIGAQGFADIRQNNYFYVDKTAFIKEWWEKGDQVTLITRPRRFGKTLNLSMLECFFDVKYAKRSDLFEGLRIWQSAKYRAMQGTWPVIFLSFAKLKGTDYPTVKKQLCKELYNLYQEYRYLLNSDVMSESDRREFLSIYKEMDVADASDSLCSLCRYLYLYHHKKVIILLDEYDTPMQEAYVSGYWEELTSLIRSLFNASFKTNPYLERAVMTGITRVSKESIFSDLNNLSVVTTTSESYADAFGFTEEEVFASLTEMNLYGEKENVKAWYDGFTFGTHRDIYNPWSITNFLDERKYRTYWANTSANLLVNKLIRQGSAKVKMVLEDLLEGKPLKCAIDEEIVFNRLDDDDDAIWSLLLAGGYLKVITPPRRSCEGTAEDAIYELSLTNKEVCLMFQGMVRLWFRGGRTPGNEFVAALLRCDTEEMNIYMNKIILSTFSTFDTPCRAPEEAEPERFYHGFVLGLLVDLEGRYLVTSNRESGYGRYDVMLEPLRAEDPAFILEFKVHNPRKEKNLQETVETALKQIRDRQYATVLQAKGIASDRIREYGFAFQGKKVLIG